MLRNLGGAGCVLALFALVFALEPSTNAQTPARPTQRLITRSINEGRVVVLSGNTRPEATNAANDRGRVSDSLPMEHMLLLLRRPDAQEQALKTLIDQLHDPNSPNFHRWLSAAEIGAQFGPAPSDIQTITGWLQQHGFTVNTVYPNGMAIDYSGTAGQVRRTFRTEIHNLTVNGVAHVANMTDPRLPAALAPAVVGIVSLHDFRPHPMFVKRRPELTVSGANAGYYVTPADLATIYNFNPVFNGGNTGQGQTIYLVEDTNLYADNDWTTFRSGFGLSGYTGASLTTIHPAPPPGAPSGANCSDPGVNGDDGEAIIDAEYASAAAPSAAIVIASCAGTYAASGVVIAMWNLINGPNPPAILSISYGWCEAVLGATFNAGINTAYQTGVAGGMSIFVSAGDQMTSSCDDNYPNPPAFQTASHGIAVNGSASTVYNVAVGGTDFSDTYSNTNSTYWNSTNTPSNGSAISYIPEIPWNNSCASELSAMWNGYKTAYGSSGFCNSNYALNNGAPYLENWGGSGGPSGCATGTPSIPSVVSGTCAGYPKPSWQSNLIGVPNDGVRDLPDVSLFASGGTWTHSYVICFSDPANNGTKAPCDGTANGWNYGWGGTSFATPIMAGIQALVNRQTGQQWGNPNYRLYALAASEYGPSGNSACNSSNGNTVSSSCIFYDVTQGDNVAPCTFPTVPHGPRPPGEPQVIIHPYYNCYHPGGYGVQSTSNSSYAPAYKATTGWDFATGIGSVNVYNLVTKWFTPESPFCAHCTRDNAVCCMCSGSVWNGKQCI